MEVCEYPILRPRPFTPPGATEETEQEHDPVPSQKRKEQGDSMVRASPVRILYKDHLTMNVIFGIVFASLALLRWYEGRAELDSATTLIGLVDFIVHILVWALPQPMISINCAGLENYMRTAAMVLDVYSALLVVNIEYLVIGIIPFMIFLFIGALAWKSRETIASHQYKNNEEVLSAKNVSSRETEAPPCKSSELSSDKLVCFAVISYLLQLSLVTWTQYEGQQGCTPILSDFLLFMASALGALGALLASPLAGVDSRAASIQVLPVLHKTCTVLLLVAVHTLAAEWLGEDMIYVCLPELIVVLVWFTICFGQPMSDSDSMSPKSQVIISSAVAMMVYLTSWQANGWNMHVSWIIWVFWISLSSSALSGFHAWLLLGWPGSTSESNKLIHLLKVASTVGSSAAAILCVSLVLTDTSILHGSISSFQHKTIATVLSVFCSYLLYSTYEQQTLTTTVKNTEPQNQRSPVTAGKEYSVVGEVTHMLVTLYPKLDVLLKAQEDTLPSDVREDVTLVQSKLQNMHDMITCFESSSDVQAKAWIGMVHELACDIEDFVDHLFYGHHGETGMQEFRKRVREMDRLFSPHVHSSPANPVGLDRPRDEFMVWAMSSSWRQLNVMSILGMPGSGKTALASLVYGTVGTLERRPFERRSWLPLGLMKTHRALAYMLFHLAGDSTLLLSDSTVNLDQVTTRLKHCLQNKRYLVILDGLDNTQTWTEIKACLPENNMGSWIIITTRSKDVALFACGPYRVYRHSLLDRREAEILFYQKVFGTARGALPDVKVVSDQIFDKCDGLPLAILSVGHVLASKPSTLDEFKRPGLPWQELQSMKNAIQCSYNPLPPDVKMCLLYLSIFPVKQVIEVERLVWLWIVEGFINGPHRPSTTTQEKVKIAKGYIDVLVRENLISYHGEMKMTISIHPVIHSFIVCMSMEQNFATLVHSQQEDVSPSNGTARRLSLVNRGKEDQAAAPSYGKNLRSVTVFNSTSGIPVVDEMTQLHVLDLEGCKGPVCLDDLHKLLFLKYLGLRGTDVSELPAQIEKLTCLETLDVRSTKVKEIPSSILGLKKLMRLLAGNAKLPCGIRKMKMLFALSCPDVATNSMSIMQELGEIDNLTELELICEPSQVSGEKKQVTFPSHGFRSLHKLSVQFGYSSLTFETGALPNVEVLGLKLDKGLPESTRVSSKGPPEGSNSVAGIKHLRSLNNVYIKYSRDDANSKVVVDEVEAAMSCHPNKPLITVEVDEE